jgi:type IV secretory pathway VirJ component
MRYKTIILVLISMLFSSCSLLVKERKIANSGIERHDFDLPVFVYASSKPLSKNILFLLSGDGGWIGFDDDLAMQFAKEGFHTIGFNSRSYFWDQKTPQQTVDDLVLLIKKYSSMYKANRIYLTGYSFGADVIPFVYNLLPPDIKRRVVALQMLSPFASTDFDVHITDLMNLGGDNYAYNVKAEVKKIKIPVFCFYGEQEEPKPLNDILQKNFFLGILPGDHHYETAAYQQITSSLSQ